MLLHGAGKTIKKIKGLGGEKYTKEKLYEANSGTRRPAIAGTCK